MEWRSTRPEAIAVLLGNMLLLGWEKNGRENSRFRLSSKKSLPAVYAKQNAEITIHNISTRSFPAATCSSGQFIQNALYPAAEGQTVSPLSVPITQT